MSYQGIPEKPLTAGLSDKLEQAERIWFFEQEGGRIIYVKEEEADSLMRGQNQTLGIRTYPPKLIGVGTGEKFRTALIEARGIFQKEGVEKAQERIRKGVEEELEGARGNIIRPRDFSTIGRGGAPVNLSQLR